MPLERLEEELYKAESEEVRSRSSSSGQIKKPSQEEKAPEWEEEEEIFPKGPGFFEKIFEKLPSIRRWFVGGVIVITVILLGIAGFYLYQGFTARGVLLEMAHDSEVPLGVPFTVTVNYTNTSRSILKDARLSVTLPEGLSFFGASSDQRIESKDPEDIGVGGQGKGEFRVIALQNSEQAQTISASLDYVASQLGSRFLRETSSTVFVGEPAIRLSMTTPEKILSGEEFEVRIAYENISRFDFSDLEMRMEYPPVFKFSRSSVPPSEGNYLWRLGNLRPDSSGELIIKGIAIGKAESFLEINSDLSVALLGKRYAIDKKMARLSISPSPLSLEIVANNKPEYIAGPGEKLDYTITYRNNTDVTFRDIAIKANLLGEMYDFFNVNTDGFFNSLTNSVIWNASAIPSFRSLAPGESGTVHISIALKNDYPIKRLSDKNFKAKASVQIESPTVPANVAAEKTVSFADVETKIKGRAVVDAKAFFRDAASGILNKGPLPPKVGLPTNYTIHWILTNFSTDLENAEIRGFLQQGVTFTGMTKSNIAAVPTYNERTQEVVWKVGNVIATKGVIGQPAEAIFQIAVTPSALQAGQFMPLVSQTELRAKDSFTGLDIFSAAPPLTSYLLYDTTVTQDQGIVVQ